MEPSRVTHAPRQPFTEMGEPGSLRSPGMVGIVTPPTHALAERLLLWSLHPRGESRGQHNTRPQGATPHQGGEENASPWVNATFVPNACPCCDAGVMVCGARLR
jgi:hypothetical protein